MKIKFPKCNYEVCLYTREENDRLGECYWSKTFETQKEVKDFLEKRSKNEIFHFSVSLIGGLSSW